MKLLDRRFVRDGRGEDSSSVRSRAAAWVGSAGVVLFIFGLVSSLSGQQFSASGPASAVTAQDAAATRIALSPRQQEMSYRTLLDKNPNSVDAMVGLATTLTNEHQPEAAVYYLQQAVEIKAQDHDLRDALGLALLTSGRNVEAEQVYRSAITLDVQDETAFVNLGAALSRQRRFDDAIDAYNRALLLNPKDEVALLSRAEALIALLRFTQAKPEIESYTRLHSEDSQAHYLLGITYRHLNEDEQAEEELRKAAALDAGNYDLRVNLGAVLLKNGKFNEAIRCLQKALETKPEEKEAHYLLARAYRAANLPQLAKSEDSKVQSIELADVVDQRAVLLGETAQKAFELGEFQKAAGLYNEIVQLSPQNYRPYYDLALTYGKLQDPVSERRALEHANALNPSASEVLTQLSVLDISNGDTVAAAAHLELALKINPQSAAALENLGILCTKTGDLSKAEHLLRQAAEIDPASADNQRNLGLVLAANGNYDGAIVTVMRGLRIAPKDGLAWIALGRIYKQVGSLPQAADAFRTATHYAPASEQASIELANLLAAQPNL
jgi:Flp pilus assembly protein TadD